MPKFSGNEQSPMRINVIGPMQTTDERIPTFNGGDGYAKTAETELFQLAVTNMVGEKTFYEDIETRDTRFEDLIHRVTKTNPDFFLPKEDGRTGFVAFLRDKMNMRSASLVVALEYAKAGGHNARQVIAGALQRGDEPGEAVGYWLSHYGKSMPASVKRGIADAAVRLYNQYALLKYDGQSRGVRFADVIELTHPSPTDFAQSLLFRHAIDRRHNKPFDLTSDKEVPLSMIYLDHYLKGLDLDARRNHLRNNPDELKKAGWTWERLSGWLPGGMDAEAWEAIIPTMGYMALLRNLRNFEEAKVSKKVLEQVAQRIMDSEKVAKSRQFPYRFWSAYKNNASLTFAYALEQALEYATQNIPELPGRSLILIDTSSSMTSTVSNKSQVKNLEIGALFAAATAKKAHNADVVIYGDRSARFDLLPNESTLRFIQRVEQSVGLVGHGTMTWQSIGDHFNGHDRVVVFTDGQTSDSDGYYGNQGPSRQSLNIPMLHVFDLGGYRTSMAPSGEKGRYSYGGFSDATFTIMKYLEDQKSTVWPF